MSPNTRGALFMSASMALFVMNDAMMKSVADQMSLFQALFIRGTMGIAMLVALAAGLGALRLRIPRRDRLMVGLRTLAEIVSTWLFVTALFNMPIANATAIMQALPLTVTLGGALFFGERVGWQRLAAIAVGFAGVMLIVRPGAEGFTVYSLYAVAAVLSVTVRDLAARGVSIETPSTLIALAAAVGVWIFGAVGLAGMPWQPVSVSGFMTLAAAAVAIAGGYLFSILTMRVGEIGFVAPFRYMSMLWALFFGLVLFGEWPDAMTLSGAAIVVSTGIFTVRRERKLAAERAAAGPGRGPGQACVDNPGDSH